MINRTHLLFTAIRESQANGLIKQSLKQDIISGLTVAIVAVPLAMSLAIASGVPPQHGLYTSIIAGIVIALFGGSRFNISGPTAAFVVLLLPVTAQFGLGGLVMATLFSGILLVAMGLAGLGKLVRFVPHPVIVGFTSGIGVVIAVLQLENLLGLHITEQTVHFPQKAWLLLNALPSWQWQECLVGLFTLLTFVIWPRFKIALPSHLIALVVGTLVSLTLTIIWPDLTISTIGSSFSYTLDGVEGRGIPATLPHFILPWQLLAADGEPIGLNFALISQLSGPAFTIAMLGAIESLLCATVADGMKGTRHNPDGELIGQGLGNIIAPFFAGIPATAAIARTATNIRAGGQTPIAAIVHGVAILLIVVAMAPIMSYVPMSGLAAILLVVAWNMAEVKQFAFIIKSAPRQDIIVLLTCFTLTVVFDMVLAVGVGLVLASLMFIHRMSALTSSQQLSGLPSIGRETLPAGVCLYDINGPLFFGAADSALRAINVTQQELKLMLIDVTDVPTIDITGIIALRSALARLTDRQITVVLIGLNQRIQQKLEVAEVLPAPLIHTSRDIAEALTTFSPEIKGSEPN